MAEPTIDERVARLERLIESLVQWSGQNEPTDPATVEGRLRGLDDNARDLSGLVALHYLRAVEWRDAIHASLDLFRVALRDFGERLDVAVPAIPAEAASVCRIRAALDLRSAEDRAAELACFAALMADAFETERVPALEALRRLGLDFAVFFPAGR